MKAFILITSLIFCSHALAGGDSIGEAGIIKLQRSILSSPQFQMDLEKAAVKLSDSKIGFGLNLLENYNPTLTQRIIFEAPEYLENTKALAKYSLGFSQFNEKDSTKIDSAIKMISSDKFFIDNHEELDLQELVDFQQ